MATPRIPAAIAHEGPQIRYQKKLVKFGFHFVGTQKLGIKPLQAVIGSVYHLHSSCTETLQV